MSRASPLYQPAQFFLRVVLFRPVSPMCGNRQVVILEQVLMNKIIQFCVVKFFARAIQKHDFCMSVLLGRIYIITVVVSSGPQVIVAANWVVAILKTDRSM
jgi:hypothetical protein